MFKYMLLSLSLMTAVSANSMSSWFRRSPKISPEPSTSPMTTTASASDESRISPEMAIRPAIGMISPTSVRISQVAASMSPVSAIITASTFRDQSIAARVQYEGLSFVGRCPECHLGLKLHIGGPEGAAEYHANARKMLRLGEDPANKAAYCALEIRQDELAARRP